VFGAAIIDRIARPDGRTLTPGTSTPGTVTESHGGVARNVAEVCARLGSRPTLISVVGDDAAGAALLRHTAGVGVGVRGTVEVVEGATTATYVAFLDGAGELHAAVADTRVMQRLGPPLLRRHAAAVASAAVVASDGNLSADGFAALGLMCAEAGARLIFEPTSVAKSVLPIAAGALSMITLTTPNFDELAAMA
ncbi:unnamed protein product, partial [Phaeothamnion confervicola]